ncbi:Ribosomal RNA-processing 36 [Hyphodiscus hymeniophilus]|uniref:rRNA biogenesis protein RRP36 n=1 Tax=Hyphodiscus hymeniophilus TaxID=353542 RepID=A0A9P7AWK4_9HELO|nr:Ribosomal RNA-processing 36 [Hyphodiscus hymeniophilus]
MSSVKRKTPTIELQRRVRARREASEELDSTRSSNGDGSSEEDSNELSSSESGDESVSSKAGNPSDVASISFGALAKAHASLTRPGKLKSKLNQKDGDTWEDNEATERKAGKKDRRDFNRSSKHAPTEISSKKAVSRRREVVPIAKREYRDPRFEPTTGLIDQSKVHQAYSFLDDYREDEMKDLKNGIKAAKDEDSKERLKKVLASMESKKKAQIRKSKEQEILDKHRKEEKEAVKQGKKPFYLKKAEQKKRVLLDQYGELKGKQLDHVIERRRKKIEGKEKKRMPFARRGVES